MYLTVKQVMVKLDCDYQQILQMVANNKLQPFYINEAVVSDAKVKALLIINPHYNDSNYHTNHLMYAEEEVGMDWRFRKSDCIPATIQMLNKPKPSKQEQRCKVILEAIKELDYDPQCVFNKTNVEDKVTSTYGRLFNCESAFESAWRHGGHEGYFKIDPKKVKV